MKLIFISIFVAGLLIIGVLVFNGRDNGQTAGIPEDKANNVSIVDGKQMVEIDVLGGGYSPQISRAKANIPTVLRMKTNGFFSCAGALSLPSIKYRENLPLSGVTDIVIPPQASGSKFQGICAMGMYSFIINFES